MKVLNIAKMLLVSLCFADVANASTGCVINVKKVWYQMNGLIQIQAEDGSGICGGTTCQISGATGWTSETARAALSMLMLAQTTGTPVYIEHEGQNFVCTTNNSTSESITNLRLGGM